MAGDHITHEPREPGLPPAPPEPDDDAPPRPSRLDRWTTTSATTVIVTGLAVGLFALLPGAMLGRAFGVSFHVVGPIAAAVGFVAGVLVAVTKVNGQVGKGVRVTRGQLPRGARPLPPAPRGDVRVADRPGVLALLASSPPRHVDRLRSEHGKVSAVAFAPDGRVAASAGADGMVSVWDVQTGFELRSLLAFRQATQGLAFSPDGRLLVAAGTHVLSDRADPQGGVLVWDAESGQLLRQIEFADVPWSLAFFPDGRQVVVGCNLHVRFWELDGPSPTGLLAMATLLGSAVVAIQAVAVSADGQLILAGCERDDPARLIHAERGEVLRTFTGHRMPFLSLRGPGVLGVAFSPDEGRALTGSRDQTARVWDVATGNELACFRGHQGFWGWRGVVGVAWVDDRRAASVSENGVLCVWDAASGEELARYAHGGGGACLAVTRDGRLALTGGADGTVRVWEFEAS